MSAKTPGAVWFFFSELEGQRASSFRQERWCRVFLESVPEVTVFNLRGALGMFVATLQGVSGLEAFRAAALAVAPVQASVREGTLIKVLRAIKHWTLADLYLPSVVRLVLEAAWRLRRENAPVLILASSPPFSLCFAGALLKRLYRDRVILVIDMRDAWALHNALPGPRAAKKAVEGWALRCADRISTVSKGLSDEFREVYGVAVDVLYNTATHYFSLDGLKGSKLAEIDPALGGDRLDFIYTGSMPERHYDVDTLVEAGLRLARDHPVEAARLRLVFVGACAPLKNAAARHPELASLFAFVAHQPHRTAQALQEGADGLIFLGHHGEGNKGVVSTKIFEYFALRKPILPLFVQEGSDVDVLMHAFCDANLRLPDAARIVETLVQVARSGPAYLPVCRHPEKAQELFAAYGAFSREVLENKRVRAAIS